MRPSLQSGLRYGFRHCTMNWDISLRKTSLLFLASSLEVSASAVLVENFDGFSSYVGVPRSISASWPTLASSLPPSQFGGSHWVCRVWLW